MATSGLGQLSVVFEQALFEEGPIIDAGVSSAYLYTFRAGGLKKNNK